EDRSGDRKGAADRVRAQFRRLADRRGKRGCEGRTRRARAVRATADRAERSPERNRRFAGPARRPADEAAREGEAPGERRRSADPSSVADAGPTHTLIFVRSGSAVARTNAFAAAESNQPAL